jgi:uncharacterized protein YunC (DUF1805 family)
MNKRWILRNERIRDMCVSWIGALDVATMAKDFHAGKDPLEVTVRPYKKNRSREQNDMFHAWCGTIAYQTGHTKGEIKDILIESVFGTEDYVNLQGENRSRLRSTADMSTMEMSELIERATQIGIELGADVPEVTHD